MQKTLSTPKLAQTLPAGTRMGEIHISVTDADEALFIWRDVVGLTLIEKTDDMLRLGAGGKIFVVLHVDAARPVVPRSLGLYHVAIHMPERRDLARFVVRAARADIRIAPTDHLVTEAIYLWDRDGNGIELTFETPWRGTIGNSDPGAYATTADGKPHSGREALDLDDLIKLIDDDPTPDAPLPAGTRLGHVHVHVTDLDRAMRFYAGAIGFEELVLMPEWGMGDAGLGYMPHAIAFNIWAGPQARQAPPDAAGLKWFTLVVPDIAARSGLELRLRHAGAEFSEYGGGLETRDPSGNRLRIMVEAG